MNCTVTEAEVYLLELNFMRLMAETKGTGGFPWEGKVRRMGPPSSCLSISGISVCAIRLGLRRLEDGRPRDGWRRDGCPRDGGRPRRMSPRRRKADREEDREGWSRYGRCVVVLFRILWNALVDLTVWLSLMIAVVCVGGCVWVRVEERMAERRKKSGRDIALIIQFYAVRLWSYYEL